MTPLSTLLAATVDADRVDNRVTSFFAVSVVLLVALVLVWRVLIDLVRRYDKLDAKHRDAVLRADFARSDANEAEEARDAWQARAESAEAEVVRLRRDAAETWWAL